MKSVLIAGLAAALALVGTGTVHAEPNGDAPSVQYRTADGFGESAARALQEGSQFTTMSPVRVLDTRNGTGGPAGAVPGGGSILLDLTAQVPDTATAVVLNVTGVTPTLSTFVTVWPASAERPTVSNLNLRRGEIRANAVTVAVDPDRELRLYNNSGSTHLVADLAGYYALATGTKFNPSGPTRVLDSRNTGGAFGPGVARTLNLAGQVPETADSVVLNLTGITPTLSTFVTAWPTGQSRPTASSLNVAPGEITPNLVTVRLGTNRTVQLYNNSGSTHLAADLVGFYASDRGHQFHPTLPFRSYDSRDPGEGPIEPNSVLRFAFPGAPPEATAFMLNVTGITPTASTFLSVSPAPLGPPGVPSTSNLNLAAGQIAANMAVTKLGPVGQDNVRWFDLYNRAGFANFTFDLAGFFAPPPPA